MGARVTVYNRRRIGGEPAGDLEVPPRRSSARRSAATEVPLAIDELPLFALAAACARGESVLSRRGGAAREGDRPHRGDGRRAARARAHAQGDAGRLRVTRRAGPACAAARIESRGDHRIAMLGAVAGLASREGVRIEAPRRSR